MPVVGDDRPAHGVVTAAEAVTKRNDERAPAFDMRSTTEDGTASDVRDRRDPRADAYHVVEHDPQRDGRPGHHGSVCRVGPEERRMRER